LRIGHFPNVTHAHGLVAHALSRAERGWVEERVGPDVRVQWFTYNAGPSAMEALLSGDLDLTYVGPSPALNAYVRSRGEDVRVLAAATWGGAALVVQGDGRITKPEDFRGKRIATPQLGNTQDVSCRAWLAAQGYHVTQTGGDVSVVPTQNADQLPLFARGEIDAVWTVEPWVSRLEAEAKGKVYLEELDALTTVLVAGTKFLRRDPALARTVLDAHTELTGWMHAHPAEARELVRAELRDEMKREVAPELIERCWKRMRFDDGISVAAFQVFVQSAQSAGFLKDAGDLGRLVERPR
jgi:NitT/TauT family transport system substrate-binding protein